jgi:integrase
MTGKPERPPGGSVKIVRKRLADGTVKEYRYEPGRTRRHNIRKQHGAIRQLAEIYVKAPEFTSLSTKWQSARKYYLGIVEDELDWLTVDDLNDRESRGDFYELRDKFASKPDTSDKVMDALKGLLAWAYERNKISYNHALGIPRLAKAGKRRNDIVWTEDQEAIVYASFPPYLARAFRFSLFTAMRQSDMRALKWENYRDGWITYKQSKTGAVVYLPVFALAPLRELVEGLERRSDYMLTSPRGLQLQGPNLRGDFRAALTKTELKDADLHWHDLRGTCTTRLLEASCTDAEVAAITGHAIGGGTKLGDYAQRSRQLALNAYQKWNDWMARRPQVIALGNRIGNRGN